MTTGNWQLNPRLASTLLLAYLFLHLARRVQRPRQELRLIGKGAASVASSMAKRKDLRGKRGNQVVVADHVEQVASIRQIRPPRKPVELFRDRTGVLVLETEVGIEQVVVLCLIRLQRFTADRPAGSRYTVGRSGPDVLASPETLRKIGVIVRPPRLRAAAHVPAWRLHADAADQTRRAARRRSGSAIRDPAGHTRPPLHRSA
jgi:hypothetical protein